MLNHPMSSPMIMMMFGFVGACACAVDAASNRAALPPRTRHMKRFHADLLIVCPLLRRVRCLSSSLLADLAEQLCQDGDQLPRRLEAGATARAHVLDAARKRADPRVSLAAELHHEGLPDRQRLHGFARCRRWPARIAGLPGRHGPEDDRNEVELS